MTGTAVNKFVVMGTRRSRRHQNGAYLYNYVTVFNTANNVKQLNRMKIAIA